MGTKPISLNYSFDLGFPESMLLRALALCPSGAGGHLSWSRRKEKVASESKTNAIDLNFKDFFSKRKTLKTKGVRVTFI